MKPVATGFPDDDLPDLKKLGELTGEDSTDDSFRLLSTDADLELRQLLLHISQQRSVVGVLVIDHNGLLIASTLPAGLDAQQIGELALGMYMNTSVCASKLDHEHTHQIVCRVTKGYVVIADVGGGLLVIMSDNEATDALIPMMRSVTQLVAQ